MDWFCIINGDQRGPMGLDELTALIRTGVLKPDDYVWTHVFGDQWRLVRDVPELQPAAAPQAPAAAAAPEVMDARPVFQTPLLGVHGQRPSFSDAMHAAWAYMVRILFKPLDLALWFGLGFCAWVATLGGSAGLDLPAPGDINLDKFKAQPTLETLREALQQGYNDMLAQLQSTGVPWVALCMLLGLLMLVWTVVACWLRSRGAFMLLHRWHHPHATVSQSWERGRVLGHSLFVFRLCFGCAMAVLAGLVSLGATFSVVLPLVHGIGLTQPILLWTFLWILALLLVAAAWGTVNMMVEQFVTPIMYWRRVGVMEAWRPVLALCNERPAAVVIYLTLYPLLAFAVLVAVLAAGLATCCLGCVLLLIPFLGAVLRLPMTVFLRGVGIHFLRQWRPDLER